MGDRIQHDAEVERAVLGALLVEPKAWVSAGPSYADPVRLTRDHFTGPRDGTGRPKVFDVVSEIFRRSGPIDALAIRSELLEAGDEFTADEIMVCARTPFRLLGIRALVHRLETLRQRREGRASRSRA